LIGVDIVCIQIILKYSRPTAVNEYALSGDKASQPAGEEEHRVSDIVWTTNASGGMDTFK
jgi:hypothetical protein